MIKKPRKLEYYGSKGRLAHWINSHLPHDRSYVEPFCGMAAVFLVRKPSRTEILNDINGDLSNWWRCVRDHTDELARMTYLTPRSRDHFAEAKKVLKDENRSDDPVRRAWAIHVVLQQGFNAGTAQPHWRVGLESSTFNKWLPEEFSVLAERLKSTQIENRDALDVLSMYAKHRDVVIYVDPPYPDTRRHYTRANNINPKKLGKELLAQKGKVAISGYEDTWDHLGWRVERIKTITSIGSAAGKTSSHRVECLWMNYDPIRTTVPQTRLL